VRLLCTETFMWSRFTLEIEFLYFEDCPSHEDALARLRGVMAEVGVDAAVAITRVETEAEAETHRFTGSPTIRVNGADIDPVPEDAAFNLSCRVYRWADGRISPMPSPEMIRAALEKATV